MAKESKKVTYRPEPLRHGWGGDKKRRNMVLRERQADFMEESENPEKFGKNSHMVDENLLDLMLRG